MPPASVSRRASRAERAPVPPLRQVHLDFHTSPLIPDVGCEFDPAAFAATMQRAHVNSVTVFAKCHHGMSYYPTVTGTRHPSLQGRDLLGEMIEALHRVGIRAPVYTTVAWEEDVAHRFPEWRQLKADGTFARSGNPINPVLPHPGGWRFNDWVHPDYQDYIEAHVRELFGRYSVDGIFFDILFHAPLAHHSAASLAFRARQGFAANDDATFRRFESAAQAAFARRFTRLVRGLSPAATVFYNASVDLNADSSVGLRARQRHVTHVEIESLPSGFWGYHHFPRAARAIAEWGCPWIGMTGRFQRMWGDFGGIKPLAALEYECFRAQALGGGNSIGDQLPPRGTLDPAAYQLIGEVYRQCAEAEPFYAGSTAWREIGIVTAGDPAHDAVETALSDEGALLLCEEAHYAAAVLDDASPLGGFALLLLPDDTVVTPRLRERLRRFHAGGGRLIVSHRGGRDAEGRWALDFLPLTFAPTAPLHPTYWRARPAFWPQLSVSDRVVYAAGENVVPGPKQRILIDRVLPYFQRTDLAFCSHFQAPPVAKTDRHPAVIAGKGFVYFADPIFREYRRSGNGVVRDVWRRVVENLIGPPRFGAGLPGTVHCTARRRGRDLLLTLLHYVPVRKAIEIDVIDERMGFAGLTLRLPPHARRAQLFGTGSELPRRTDGADELPDSRGRLLITVPAFFRREPAGTVRRPGRESL
ncbi:MAG TPA: alpha-amylase family protein [Opitutaceae bacterium]|nr:alpha-amylase family protein [Opitutaceae bacterium]